MYERSNQVIPQRRVPHSLYAGLNTFLSCLLFLSRISQTTLIPLRSRRPSKTRGYLSRFSTPWRHTVCSTWKGFTSRVRCVQEMPRTSWSICSSILFRARASLQWMRLASRRLSLFEPPARALFFMSSPPTPRLDRTQLFTSSARGFMVISQQSLQETRGVLS